MLTRTQELEQKLARIRSQLGNNQCMRLRGVDWFAWLLCGASNAVLLAAETGVAEALVSHTDLFVLTDAIEFSRLVDEELPKNLQVQNFPWAHPQVREKWVQQIVGAAQVVSDRPQPGEALLPPALAAIKLQLIEPELTRYAEVGSRAASAMTEVLFAAQPHWTEFELAGAAARALLARGLEPALILSVGARRLPLYRHALPTHAPLDNIAMLVFCARGFGLYANLTRFVSFGPLSPTLETAHRQVREIEAEALGHCQPGVSLGDMYAVFEKAYRSHGHPEAIAQHHQGGMTGYQAREIVARPDSAETIQNGTIVAWNPSVRGAKIEDTFAVSDAGLHNLTFDPNWPHSNVNGQSRPRVLTR